MSSVEEAVNAVGGLNKRVFDVVVALALAVFFSPTLVIVWMLVRAASGPGAIYAHRRIGFGGRVFGCLKFRTMALDSDQILESLLLESSARREEWAATQKFRDDPRVTAIGRVLRSLSIDELPQLFNVLRGDMSLVGPRPVVQAELARYGSEVSFYLRARPGMTGLWQVSARDSGDYDLRVALDVDYVRTWSFFGDIVILLRTVRVVFFGRGSW